MTDTKAYYSPAQVADRLGVHVNQIYTWMKTGMLSHYKLGHKTIRIPDDGLKKFMRDHYRSPETKRRGAI